MQTLDEQLQNLNLYLRKLKRVISTEASFSFGNTKIVSKARVDDVLCCIQASYPHDFKDYVKRNGNKSLESHLCFQQLLNVVTKKFFLSSNQYSVDYIYFEKLLNTFIQTIQKELPKVLDDNSFKL